METKQKLFVLLNVFLIFGMLVSSFLVYEKFSPTASKYCTFGESLDCGIVNKSPYANLDGFSYLLTMDFGLPLPLVDISGISPVFELLLSNAFLGFLTLLFVLIMLHMKYKNKDFFRIKNENILKWVKGILIFGVAYGFYLFLIQHFILKTYCLFCIILDFILISLLIIVWRIKDGEVF